jgi:hypothetical protein
VLSKKIDFTQKMTLGSDRTPQSQPVPVQNPLHPLTHARGHTPPSWCMGCGFAGCPFGGRWRNRQVFVRYLDEGSQAALRLRVAILAASLLVKWWRLVRVEVHVPCLYCPSPGECPDLDDIPDLEDISEEGV